MIAHQGLITIILIKDHGLSFPNLVHWISDLNWSAEPIHQITIIDWSDFFVTCVPMLIKDHIFPTQISDLWSNFRWLIRSHSWSDHKNIVAICAWMNLYADHFSDQCQLKTNLTFFYIHFHVIFMSRSKIIYLLSIICVREDWVFWFSKWFSGWKV